MGLHVWRSERADGLIAPLAELLAETPADPLAREVVAVPTAGIERWLAQELSLRLGTGAVGAAEATAGPPATDGVCANVEFAFPGRLIAHALEAAAGLAEDADPWRPERLVWPLLRLADREPDGDWWGPARAHLASPADGRRYSAARRIADLLDRYAVHRPEMVLAWADDRDVGPDLQPVPTAHAWQPRLWRRLRADLDAPSTAERLADATARLARGEVDLDLPDRLAVFGLTALPASYLRVLTAVAATREVHLFLLHPSTALWERVEQAVPAAPRPLRRPRDDDPTAALPRNPLLSSWGRDAREMQVVFADLDAPSATHHPPVDGGPTTLLRRLQDDVRADRAPAGPPVDPDADDPRPALDPHDRSLQVHACHGRLRQVQVLRDAVLHLLRTHEDLEPRDIIVMCPDVETFAPLVDAVFGAEAEVDGAPSLRVRLADRSLRQTNPVLTVVAELLELADARLSGSEVLDLLGRAPVRRRFHLDDDDLERIETWVPDTGVRWGLHAADRDRYDLAGVEANTWRFGLRRLLTGVAMADEDLRLVADTVPYDDVEGGDVELAGRLAEAVARLERVCTTLREPRPAAAWRDVLADAVAQLTATARDESWQHAQLHRLLDEVVEQAGDTTTELHLAEVRGLLGDRLRGRPSRASHRTGDLTVSTLVPMRAVPHRVVCLLGMDDGAFPRRTVADGDDLVDEVPFVGDRDARTEDRQLLLDALMGATQHLVVTYSGRDERTNEPLPPAVPIGELLDVAGATVRPPVAPAPVAAGSASAAGAADAAGAAGAGGGSAPEAVDSPRTVRDHLVVEHPLQPFDARSYRDGHLGVDGPWSFDEVGLAAARARSRAPEQPRPLLEAPLPPLDDQQDVVDLGLLVRFLEHPSRTFLGERLGVWFPGDAEGPQDGIPLDLTGLPKWQVGDRLLGALRAGHSREDWERVERARGTLPPDPLGTEVLDEVCPVVEDIIEAAGEALGEAEPAPVEVDVALDDGRRVVGSVAGVVDDAIAHVTYSRLSARTRIAAYTRLVALSAHDPATPWRAELIGRAGGKGKKQVDCCTLGPLGEDPTERADEARQRLARLVDLYDRGMRAPAPLYGETSEAIARNLRAGKTAWHASGEWETTFIFPQEDLDACNVAVLGRVATFAELLAEPPTPDEVGEDWPECEERLVAWAQRLWDPVLAIEQRVRR